MYNCKKLLEDTTKPYYDTVKVIVSPYSDGGSDQDLVFGFKVVCDAERLGGFDLNFVVLFGIAIGIIVLAVKTPPLLIFNDMTEEERQ